MLLIFYFILAKMSHASFYLFALFQVFAVKAVGFITRSDKYVVLLAVSEKKSS